jgi:uncharacterized protein YbjT (DUF2867 family)
MSHTILITGATGTVGRRVALELAQSGASVRAGVRDIDTAADLREAGVELVHLDFGDPASVEAAVRGVERIFLLTPFVEAPVPMVQAVVDAAKAADVRFIVRLSGLGADLESPLALAREHGRGEALVKDSGIDWAVLQPSFFMENVVNYMGETVREQGALYGASGEGRAAYIAADDIARTAAAILREPGGHAGQTYVLTGPAAVNNDDIAGALSQLLGKPVNAVDVDPDDHRRGLEEAGLPGWMVDGMSGLEAVKRNGWAEATTSAVERITGRPPEALASFLDRNAAAFA